MIITRSGLNSCLKRVGEQLKKLSERDRSYFQRFIRQEEDRQIIQRAEKELGHAYEVFSVCTMIHGVHPCTEYLRSYGHN